MEYEIKVKWDEIRVYQNVDKEYILGFFKNSKMVDYINYGNFDEKSKFGINFGISDIKGRHKLTVIGE